jgi:uncharacterized 2Fe-2S/4Fe-4S cluster protein (DUF4445 family)
MAKGSIGTKYKIHFEPGNIDVDVEQGGNLLDAALLAGVKLNASCGGTGSCGTCKVFIQKGKVASNRTARISDLEYQEGICQACQTRVLSDLLVTVPLESRIETAAVSRKRKRLSPATYKTGFGTADWHHHPPLQKHYLELPPPTLKDNSSDLSRLLKGLQKATGNNTIIVGFDTIKVLPQILRQQEWKVTATILEFSNGPDEMPESQFYLANIESGNTSKAGYALAVDIGTTTIKAQLLDLTDGKLINEGAEYNGQAAFGADVITRIAYCEKPGGLQKMQSTAVNTINSLVQRLSIESKINKDAISFISVAGNTTMLQLLMGIEPKYIRLSPYVPAASMIPPLKAASFGIDVAEHVYISTLPMLASYIGGDITAGIVSVGMHRTEKLTLYMDIGTNGQIVIGNSEWMAAAACSAGPAFEGGEITHGMIATDGAIEKCEIEPVSLKPKIGTIDHQKPRGICGSGLINIVAELLESGIIERNGHFHTDIVSPYIRYGNNGYEYVLAQASETQTGHDIVINEIDIANLMRAKAAIYAGLVTLVKSVGLSPGDIQQILIAGAFGSFIDIERAIMIGLLPDLPAERFHFVGNGSLTGARLAALSTDVMKQARQAVKKMTNLELSENGDFMNNYVAALFLPHTNIEEFPSVEMRLSQIRRDR